MEYDEWEDEQYQAWADEMEAQWEQQVADYEDKYNHDVDVNEVYGGEL